MEAKGSQAWPDDRIPPLPAECLLARRAFEMIRSRQHPIEVAPRPECAVIEDIAVGANDCLRIRLGEIVHGEPIGIDTAWIQSVVDELEVLTRV